RDSAVPVAQQYEHLAAVPGHEDDVEVLVGATLIVVEVAHGQGRGIRPSIGVVPAVETTYSVAQLHVERAGPQVSVGDRRHVKVLVVVEVAHRDRAAQETRAEGETGQPAVFEGFELRAELSWGFAA